MEMLEQMPKAAIGSMGAMMALFLIVHGFAPRRRDGERHKISTYLVSGITLAGVVVVAGMDWFAGGLPLLLGSVVLVLFTISLINFLATTRWNDWFFAVLVTFMVPICGFLFD